MPKIANFYLMYLAANGKIYTSSDSSILDIHEMNYPESAGIACDVQLHNARQAKLSKGLYKMCNSYLKGKSK